MIENVPARVNEETGEQLFAPSTVESIQQLIPFVKKCAIVISNHGFHVMPYAELNVR